MSGAALRPGGWLWFAGHEFRLARRDFIALMLARAPGPGRRLANHARVARGYGRTILLAFGAVGLVAFLHAVAFFAIGGWAEPRHRHDPALLVLLTGTAFLSGSAMLAEAMEAMTRTLYSRSDVELILASPAPVGRFFAVRIWATALSVTLIALVLALPFIDVLVLRGGAGWLGAFGVVAAMGMAAAALATVATALLFQLAGPRRTRIAAQIVAAVVGAGFVIGLQVGAILTYGSYSRLALLHSPWVLKHAPGPGSALWWPAYAAMGDLPALAAVLGGSILALAAAVRVFAPRFQAYAGATAGVGTGWAVQDRTRVGGIRRRPVRVRARMALMRHKEWRLLARDPWLLSQTLMQLLYLLPPAVLLWASFDGGSGSLVLLVPILTMAAGQLAGGLAWLAISGEDAPDLVSTAPVAPDLVLRAKLGAVMGAVALVLGPFIAVLALAAPFLALVAAASIAVATASSTAIQLWFRTQARRSQFRRRQTSSRIATFAEALSSVSWAASGGALAAGGPALALIPGAAAVAVLAGARLARPAPV